MANLLLFNPDNDIALASGAKRFTPPRAALELRQAGALLPLWTGCAGDAVMCQGVNADWLRQVTDAYYLPVAVWNHTDYSLEPSPWGWSRPARHTFAMAGFAADKLPDDQTLDNIRRLSHRRTAAILTESVQHTVPLEPVAVEFDSADELLACLEAAKQTMVVKSPWSSSGRGVMFVAPGRASSLMQPIAGIMRRQGSVTVEPFLDSAREFALLFICENGRARFEGLSVFEAEGGRYIANLVEPQENLHRLLSQEVGPERLDALITAVGEAVTEHIANKYTGPVGVDMLYTPDRLRLSEVNLRMTMGFVSKELSRYVAAPARFYITQATGDLVQTPTVVDGKLAAGTQRLNPPESSFAFNLQII